EVLPRGLDLAAVGAGHQLGLGLAPQLLGVALALRAGAAVLPLAGAVGLVPADVKGRPVLAEVAHLLGPLVNPRAAHDAPPFFGLRPASSSRVQPSASATLAAASRSGVLSAYSQFRRVPTGTPDAFASWA